MLIRLIDNHKNIDAIFGWKYTLFYYLFIKLINLKKRLLVLKRWNFKQYKNIEWNEKFNIQKDSFKTKKRKHWISAFWRLYNWEDFLEQTIESHIKYFDEIILVNNKSTDKTEYICKKLEKKYPSKIKFYNYPFDIHKIWTKKYKETKENSLHSLSYYYNWTLSKTTYKYAIKLDDDHICIPEQLEKITNNIKNNWLDCFLQTPLINVYRINNTLSKSVNSLKSSFAWLFGDFGFFPISEKTYFIKLKWWESLIFPLKIKNEKISFLHLKRLKKSMWLNNYWGKTRENLKKRLIHTNFKKLEKKYIDILKNNWIK